MIMLWQLILISIAPLTYAKPEILHPLGLVNLSGNGDIRTTSVAPDKAK